MQKKIASKDSSRQKSNFYKELHQAKNFSDQKFQQNANQHSTCISKEKSSYAKQRQIQKYKTLLNRNATQANQIKNIFFNWKNSCKNQDKQNVYFTNTSKSFKEQPQQWNGQFTFNSKFNQKSKDQQFQELEQFSHIVMSDSFSGSFRVVFSSFVQLQFQKLGLCLKLKVFSSKIFEYLIQMISQDYKHSKKQIQIDRLSLVIYRLSKNRTFEYKLSDINDSMQKFFKNKTKINSQQFARIFETSLSSIYLINAGNQLAEKTDKQLIKCFFEVLIQLYDTQIKLKKICQANQQRLIKLIVQLSLNQDLNLKMLGEFLYFDIKKSKKWLILRFQEFFQVTFGKKNFSLSFLKWIKQIN